MGSNYKISVILPVFNVAAYIERCIESLQAQTLHELEFIFVNDCSTDDSMEAVISWATKDSRVHILQNKENLGAGASRNRGIEVARGEYLGFVDPDDYVSPEFFELLYATATADGRHDIAKGSCCKVNGITGEPESSNLALNDRIKAKLDKGEPLYCWFTYEHVVAIWKETLFKNTETRYGASPTSQDTVFQLRACYQTNDIVFEERACYYYVQRLDSLQHKDLERRTYSEIEALTEKIAFLSQKGLDRYAKTYIETRVEVLATRFWAALNSGKIDETEVPLVVGALVQVLSQEPGMEYTKLQPEQAFTTETGQILGSVYTALMEHHVVLPEVSRLQVEQKVAGALRWIDFIESQDQSDRFYLDACINAMVVAIEETTSFQKAGGLHYAYCQIIKHLGSLPAQQHGILWLKLHRRLASKENLYRLLGKIRENFSSEPKTVYRDKVL